MKKLTLVACTLPALFFLNGCFAEEKEDKVHKLCSYYDGLYYSCTDLSYCPDSNVAEYIDTYPSSSSCNTARISYNGADNNTNNSNTNNSSTSNDSYYPWLLCTKTTYNSSGTPYYSWSCYGNNECKPGYTWNAPIARHTVESCAAEGKEWLDNKLGR